MASQEVSADYHSYPYSKSTEKHEDLYRCYNCKYRVEDNEGYQEFDCEECGNYIVSNIFEFHKSTKILNFLFYLDL